MTTCRGVRAWVFAATLAGGVMIAAPAAADEAQAQYEQALSAYDEARYPAALAGFEAAFDATGSPNAKLFVARALAKLGRPADAYRAMKETLELARDEERYAKTRDAAAVELAELEVLVGMLVVGLADDLDGAEVTIDGEPLPPEALGKPWAVSPGVHELRATLVGAAPWARTVEVAGGATQTVVVSTGLEESEPVPVDEPQGSGLSTVQWAGIGVGVAGLAGLAVFAGTAVSAQSTFDDIEATCGGGRCTDPALADDIDRGKTMQTVANVSAGVGGAVLAAGVLMVALGGASEGEGDVAVRVGPTGAMVFGRF